MHAWYSPCMLGTLASALHYIIEQKWADSADLFH